MKKLKLFALTVVALLGVTGIANAAICYNVSSR